MLRISTIFLACMLSVQIFSQRLAPDKYWIPFTDKNNSNFSIDKPQSFLSFSSIERRQRHGIEVTEQDIPVNYAYIDSLSSIGLSILGSSKWFNAAIVKAESLALIYKALEFSFVKSFDPETAYRIVGGSGVYPDSGQAPCSETKAGYSETDYGRAFKQLNILGGNSLHESGYRGRGIKIAVLDAGFYAADSLQAFRHLWEENRILGFRDFVNSKDNIFKQSSHGMSVLSTMAANIPGTIIGTAPEASYWLLRTEDAGSEFKIEEANWLMAAEFSDSAGVDIITSSLGYNQFNDPTMDYTYEEMNGLVSLSTRAADIAFDKGMIVIASAGNEGNKAWGKITAPSDAFNVLSIGAVDTAMNMAPFSSRGPASDNRVKPDLLAVGYQTAVINSSGSVINGFGTSFAAPQIAGLTACLWQAFPYKKNSEIIQAIKRSSDNYFTPDNDRGYGVPDFLLALSELFELPDSNVQIRIVPNPYIHSFEVSFDMKVQEIKIVDMSGITLASFRVDLNPYEKIVLAPVGIEPGIYLLTGRNKNQSKVSRLIKK